jgi:threonine/homoserine/homoserine lactone efflux protein
MLAIFIQSLIIGYSGAIMPGPMFTYTVEKSMRYGAKTGVSISMGHIFLELLLVIAIFAGAGKYLGTDTAKIVVGILGGSILGYLGFSMIKDVYYNKISLDVKNRTDGKQGSVFIAGIVLSMSNPYFIIWWSAIGLALIMNAYNLLGIMGIAAFFIGHILADISWFSFVAAIVSKARHLFNIKIYKAVILVLAAFMIFFGASFFVESIGKLLKL